MLAPNLDKIAPKTATPREHDFRDMAMEALKNLVTQIPDWQRRLNDLSGQVEKRQTELAALSAADRHMAEVKSLRNKGSTESLKPQDDGPAFITEPTEPMEITPAPADATMTAPSETADLSPPVSSTTEPNGKSASPDGNTQLATPTPQRGVMAAPSPRIRVQAKRKLRSSSVASAEGIQQAYRTRSMIIVYYDSYVQGFFDEMVRFISSSRNLIRKAKMAAKVAQIKRMAEDDENKDGSMSDESTLPSLRYMSTRRFGAMRPNFGPPGTKDQPPDVYDKLDKSLEFVQCTCEHGAHQFLRDADCNEEIKKIQDRLCEVFTMAEIEAERVEREEPELAKEMGDLGKIRTRRPISMRREVLANGKEGAGREEMSIIEAATPETEKSSIIEVAEPIEAATKIEADEGIEVDLGAPVLHYRSTRGMRTRPLYG